ncbi:PREDICTED: probable ADP-ribosylation factor GTPase-activating protein AGD11 isoform X1 [Lupinus angustifolius]|uniref:probable ADP-ribosylation factor GTPase-activating protein AGD11 isoform X1 n=1 Tax=Lupinus angustifolius TaxID=3871 RepID=UPI00092E5223|nr:PREDICTED: probable ADP-ribosylation factor GTPase-activating protein AGD11 isoform X1 [Lupinus angustifolius]XP_019434451.1 PREDICTED: probable ADP-ribosylation factor GTPase-activating protein AGD11 isoform X1 [Lupinus angustifolius]XP_019434452.1 PREDICTED: probable ADP-ribosylation factor GTPase-activating protein AGD11 isoform X1 [Lupinus angustifolius]
MSIQHNNSDIDGVSGSGSCLYDLFCSETPSLNSQSQRDRWLSSGPQKRLDHLMCQAGNKYCADCGSSEPKWVSSSFGVFICIKCSGIHRSLGVHISKVLSLKLDEWTDEQVDALVKLGGNTVINKKYEACLPNNIKKPNPYSSNEERIDFIRRKYELLQFLDSEENLSCPFVPSHQRTSSSIQNCLSSRNYFPDKKNYDKQPTKNRIGLSFRNSRGRKDYGHKSTKKSTSLAGMVEFVGLIMVNVVKGTNLAVRDVMTSDPYVILSLGHQSVKTRVIKNNLNPVWNESLMLSIPENIPPLKVLVYDKDTFSTDDFMGEAEIDIQPLLSAAKAYEKSSINESMQLGKWVASGDNTLVKDGIIFLEEGKVRQEISMRLQKVERGVLEIELECVPLTQ